MRGGVYRGPTKISYPKEGIGPTKVLEQAKKMGVGENIGQKREALKISAKKAAECEKKRIFKNNTSPHHILNEEGAYSGRGLIRGGRYLSRKKHWGLNRDWGLKRGNTVRKIISYLFSFTYKKFQHVSCFLDVRQN